MCSCMPTSPGMTERPERSTVFVPSGILTNASVPISRILPWSMRTVWFSAAGEPVPSMTRTCWRAITGASIATKDFVTPESADLSCAERAGARLATRRIAAESWRMRLPLTADVMLDGAPRIAFTSEIQRLGKPALLEREQLCSCHFAHSAHADMCRRLGRIPEARASYEKALALASQEPDRRFLARRLQELK